MKRIPAFFLFAILLINVAGFYVYYVIALQRIHREMRAELKTRPDKELTRLVLSREAYLKSIVEEDEIKVRGKMFDVARIRQANDSVIVFAIHDEKEDDLLAFASEVISKPFKQDSRVTGSVLQFISLVFLPGQQVNVFENDGNSIPHESGYCLLIPRLSLQHEAPPPRAVC